MKRKRGRHLTIDTAHNHLSALSKLLCDMKRSGWSEFDEARDHLNEVAEAIERYAREMRDEL